MALDKYSRLKIATIILDTSVSQLAGEHDVTAQSIKGVCEGSIQSARLTDVVESTIEQAEQHFSSFLAERNLQPVQP